MPRNNRPDHDKGFRSQFESNKKKILATQTVCGICGNSVDKSLKWPDPMAGVIDHIIPIQKGGHPSALENLQLAHVWCNRQKSDKLQARKFDDEDTTDVDNRDLPLSMEWEKFKGA